MLEHSCNKQGSYNIKVKATDVWEAQSDWATILVSMPKNNQLINRSILNFLEQHPILCQLLQRFLKL